MKEDLKSLEESIGYYFKDQELLKLSLTHPSRSNEEGLPREMSNQRLEFLGDAVLEMLSSSFLYEARPMLQEGEMTKLRASLVCEKALSDRAREIFLYEYIKLGKGEEREGINLRDSVISDTLEALIGAVYLDGGIKSAETFVLSHVLPAEIEKAKDTKTELQEIVTRERKTLSYEILSEEGPMHDRTYTAGVFIDGELISRAEGHSKKKAEQNAAEKAIKRIKKQECI